jgi:hypothetical protein
VLAAVKSEHKAVTILRHFALLELLRRNSMAFLRLKKVRSTCSFCSRSHWTNRLS